jgi:hypothetical protein
MATVANIHACMLGPFFFFFFFFVSSSTSKIYRQTDDTGTGPLIRKIFDKAMTSRTTEAVLCRDSIIKYSVYRTAVFQSAADLSLALSRPGPESKDPAARHKRQVAP